LSHISLHILLKPTRLMWAWYSSFCRTYTYISYLFSSSECGMCSHRYCSTNKPTECSTPKLERCRRASFTQSKCFYSQLL